MIKELGEVVELKNKIAKIKFTRSSSCGKCTACGMTKDQKEVIINVKNTNEANIGDFVDIEIETKKAMVSSAIAYVFPLIMLIVGVVLGYVLVNSGVIDGDKEVIGALFGIGLTFVSYLIIRNLEPIFKIKLKTAYKMIKTNK
jgi:sigma-E factor negative regulatory protein RseC